MTKHIIGSYNSVEEAVNKVLDLKIEGHRAEDITVITNRNNKDDIENHTDVQVKSGIPEKNSGSFTEKIKQIFTDDITNPYEQLIRLGIPEGQAKVNQGNLKSEKIIIVIDK
ncbi:general stress protein [Virgibacillus sp. C22-A2]|uniref:General stress protein n=1 Tax=Virgibacillus tibetensis TaxID=3042313 RepID=A0ABU6KJ69_9BACI|nr:general stress protein [Virgibacillus sp. C22-A2]